MGAKQIFRMQKLKSAASLNRSLKHAFREQNTPNADPARLGKNQHVGAKNTKEAMAKYRSLMATQKKVRKNAVHVVEYLITASPDFFNNKKEGSGMLSDTSASYFNEALEFINEKHGAENVFYAGIHLDEKTPHMYAYVVPRDDKGKLNCRHFFGQPRALSQLQDDFHDKVASKFKLERGLRGSKAKHKEIKKYYEEINQVLETKPEEPTRVEHLLAATGASQKASKRVSQSFLDLSILRKENERLELLRAQERESMAKLNESLLSKLEEAKKDLSEIDSLRENLKSKIEEAENERAKLERIASDLAMKRDNGVRELETKVERLEKELSQLSSAYHEVLDERNQLLHSNYHSPK